MVYVVRNEFSVCCFCKYDGKGEKRGGGGGEGQKKRSEKREKAEERERVRNKMRKPSNRLKNDLIFITGCRFSSFMIFFIVAKKKCL